MSKDPYKNYEGASEGLGFASAAAGAATATPNPMGVVQNAQLAYHMSQYRATLHESSGKALANYERRVKDEREMQTPQVQASEMRYGGNGITAENGYVRDSEGKITYVGKSG